MNGGRAGDAMTMLAQTQTALPAGWLRDKPFDLVFILGVAALAVTAGWVAVYWPGWFPVILVVNLWLLGYHHVISTYTRLCFDKQSFREHRFLVIWLPLIVFGAALAAGYGLGSWALATVYLYWQAFHYARQSYGVSRVYRRKAGATFVENERLATAALYMVPLWGVLHRSAQAPETFLGLELKVLPVLPWMVDAVGVVAVALFLWWAITRAMMLWRGALPVAHTLYMLTHFLIFYVGYILIENIDRGWLVLNVWHNAQYILFVWIYNNNRFKGGVVPEARLLSTLSQSRNLWLYLLVCFAISSIVYFLLSGYVTLLVPAVMLFMTINFHHYIVDGLIWKVRKKPLQKTLGLT